jgi:hypothetical protein
MILVRRKPRAAALVVTALAGLALASAGCADGTDPPTVASAASPGGSGPASASADPVARYVEARRAWVKCLRKQGFQDVPDPDAKGNVDLQAHGGRAKTDPRWLAAQEECKQFSMEVPAELEPKLPPLTAEQLAWRREYAKCMRANGMPRWPDPGPDGEWPENMIPGELTAQEQANNIPALQICDPVIQGRPPTTPDPRNTGAG